MNSSENAINNVSANRSSCTENRCITQLLPELLAHLRSFAWRVLCWLIRHLHRRYRTSIRITRSRRLLVLLLSWIRGIVIRAIVIAVGTVHASLLIIGRGEGRGAVFHADVVLGEDAGLAGADVLALPPLGVEVLGDGDVVVGLEVEVARVRVGVAVEGDDVGDLVVSRRGRWSRARVVSWRLLGGGWLLSVCNGHGCKGINWWCGSGQ